MRERVMRPGKDTPAGARPGKGALDAALTVEAALVMSVTLFATAALLQGVFDMHARTAGSFVLAEGLEKYVFFEAGAEKERGRDREDVAPEQTEKLHCIFGCGNASLTLSEGGLLRAEGSVKDKAAIDMSVRTYDPEKFLRTVTAVKDAAGSGDGA